MTAIRMALNELRRVLGGALNVTTARFMNRGGATGAPRLDLAGYRALPTPTPRDFAELLAYRSNRERARLTEAALRAAGLPVVREPYRTVEGAGVNLFVDVGAGPRTLVLASHHDAVPGSPGANDNAAAVGIRMLRKRCVRGSKRTIAFAPKSVSQTTSPPST